MKRLIQTSQTFSGTSTMHDLLKSFALLTLLVLFAISSQAQVKEREYYHIVSQQTPSLALEHSKTSIKQGTVKNTRRQNTDNQRWRFAPAGGSYYYIIGKNSLRGLDVYGRSKKKETIVHTWRINGINGNQKWKLVPAGNGYYYLQAQHSGLYLTIQTARSGSGIVQRTRAGSSYQKFKLLPANRKVMVGDIATARSLFGPEINQVTLFHHKFNFRKSITVKTVGDKRVVKGSFSHYLKLRPDDKYFFIATFDKNGQLIEIKERFEDGGFKQFTGVVTKGVNLVLASQGVPKPIRVPESWINRMRKKAGEVIHNKGSWEKSARVIAELIATEAALTYGTFI